MVLSRDNNDGSEYTMIMMHSEALEALLLNKAMVKKIDNIWSLSLSLFSAASLSSFSI